MKRIFITGGTGFFGKSMLDYRRRHHEVLWPEWTILSRAPARFIANNPVLANQPGVCFVTGDVRDFKFPEGHFDAVIHAATDAVTTLADAEMASVIVDGTRHVIDFAKTCGATKLMLTSSGAVYGPQVAPCSEEKTPCEPETTYGKGKLLAEKMCVDSGLHVLLPRCFSFVGPYLSRGIHFAIGNFIQNCLDRVPIIIKGDGSPVRSYLSADDLVEWLFVILDRGESGRPYNVGSPAGITIKDLAEAVKTALNSDVDIRVRGAALIGASNFYVPCVARAMQELGLEIKLSLREAIRASVCEGCDERRDIRDSKARGSASGF